MASSSDDTPTYTTPSKIVADCVMIADGWLSSWVFHRSAPLALLIAMTAPPPPKGPWLPITRVLSVNAGVTRALSPVMPV